MVSQTQLCWRYHSLPLSQWYFVIFPITPSLPLWTPLLVWNVTNLPHLNRLIPLAIPEKNKNSITCQSKEKYMYHICKWIPKLRFYGPMKPYIFNFKISGICLTSAALNQITLKTNKIRKMNLKPSSDFNEISFKILIHKNALQIVVCKILAISFRSQWVYIKLIDLKD